MTSSADGIEALLNPKNIVILGATDRPGNWAARVWRNLKRCDYPGRVYPYNPSRDIVWDTRCYRSFAELPEPPDHLVLLIPAASVPDALARGAAAGARSATVMTSGFGELSDAESMRLNARLAAVIAETGIAVSGPNCLGNMYAASKLMTMPDDRPQKVVAGSVSIVGQSGGIPMAIKRTLEERGIATGAIVTSGNEAGLTTADYIAWFAKDPHTKIIVSYLEAVHDTEAFLAACRAARSAGKPVIVVKLGASDDGRAAALAHTGRLAGSMDAFDAVAGKAGAIRARNLDQLVEIVEYCVHARLPEGRGLGAITFSGGLRGLLLDAAAAHGLAFAPLARATRARLEKLLSVGSVIGNPIDAGFAALTSQNALLDCVEALLADPGVHVLLMQEELPRAPGTERKESNLRALNAIAATAKKPIAYVTMISHGLTDYSRDLRAELGNLTFLQEPDKAVGAVRAIADYADATRAPVVKRTATPNAARAALKVILARENHSQRSFPAEHPERSRRMRGDPPPHKAPAGKTLHNSSAVALAKAEGNPILENRMQSSPIGSPSLNPLSAGLAGDDRLIGLSEPVSKSLLKAYGIASPKEFVAHSAREAEWFARKIGFPVVAKAVSAALAHKSDVGGVMLGLNCASDVRAAYAKVTKAFGKKLDGVLIAEQVTDGIELVLGVTRDPEMGPVILFGEGGVNLELHRDVALASVPLDARGAEALIARTKISKRIAGYRGTPKLDKAALVTALIALSQLSMDAGPRLQSIDVNPFLLRKRGGVALDALVVLS